MTRLAGRLCCSLLACIGSSGCIAAVLAVGVAAGAGAVIYVADDEVETQVGADLERAQEVAIAVVGELGSVRASGERTEGGIRVLFVEGRVSGTEITVRLRRVEGKGLRLRVKGRKDLLPDTDTAERVLEKIRGRLD